VELCGGVFQDTLVMGILNVTPDSFYDGGRYNHVDAALRRAEEMLKAGADIIDVGGESTRPAFTPISAEEEISRVLPVITAIKERFGCIVSLDTYKPQTAANVPADIINSVLYSRVLAEAAKVSGAHLVITSSADLKASTDFLADLLADIKASASDAISAGVKKEKIIIDGGVGFGKTMEQNLSVIKNIAALKALGYPVLLGASRKSVIGNTLNIPCEERLPATLAITAFAALNAVDIVRVHDPKENYQAIKMLKAIRSAR
jgi:dihydropteroate synthase